MMHCLKNEQECNIRFKNLRESWVHLKFLNLIIDDWCFLNGFKISHIDQLIIALIFSFGVILV